MQVSRGWWVPFQAQGRWSRTQEGIIVQGNGVEQNSPTPSIPFFAAYTTIQPRAMSARIQTTLNSQAFYCQR